jgi:SAM-dependent methyltransferase
MNQEAIWEYFQNEAPSSFDGSEARIKFLVSQLPSHGKVLNIGIGAGVFERLATARGLDVYSLDPSQRSIENLRDQLDLGDKAQVGYSRDIPFSDGSFQAVVMSEVLEHLDDRTIADTIKEVERVLVPGGAFLGTVPARESLHEQAVVCPCCEAKFHRWGHQQSFDVARMRTLLNGHFVMASVREVYFVNWSTLNWKGRLVAGFKQTLLASGIHGSGENIYFLGRKR